MLEKLIKMNNELLQKNKDNKKLILIKKLLQNKNIFFEIDITTAYQILNDLNINNKEEVYLKLISK